MDFTVSIEQARDVNRLLDYYFGNRPMYHEEAAAAWHRLAFASRGALHEGWTTTEVERAFVPKRPDADRYNPHGAEDCDACFEHNGPCPYHQGVEAGLGLMRRAVGTLVDYPEQLADTLDFKAGQRTS